MKFFKKKINFDQFSVEAIASIFEVYKNKDEVIDKAQQENTYKITEKERSELWQCFILFIPIGLHAYAEDYYKGAHESSDISRIITGAYLSYLAKNENWDDRELEDYTNKMLDYFEKIEKESSKISPQADKDHFAELAIAFANLYSKVDRKNEESKNFDKNFLAFKLAKTYLAKRGVLSTMFDSFNIIW